MAFQRSPDRLEKAITATFADTEIDHAMQRAGFTEAFVRSRIAGREDEIWEAVGKEIEAFQALQVKYETSLSAIQHEVGRLIDRMRRALIVASIMGGIALLPLTILALWWPELLPDFSAFSWGWLMAQITDLDALEINALLVFVSFSLLAVSSLSLSLRTLTHRKAELAKVLGIAELLKAIEEATHEIDRALLEKGARPLIREIINVELQPSYAMTLPQVSGPGLAEVFDPMYEIPTAAKDLLRRRLETMPGGSIGIAGPRGAGKTTLIRALCDEFSGEIAGRPVLSVMSAAPVQYDARDFVLHLFSLICRRLLRLEGIVFSEEFDLLASPVQVSLPVWRSLRRLSFLLFLAAYFLLVLGTLLFWSSLRWPAEPAAAGAAARTVADFANNSWMLVLRDALGLTPGPVLLWGLVLMIAGFGLFSYTRSARRAADYVAAADSPPITREALRWLRLIKFQQSFTSGWSGSLKLPVGLSGGLTGGRSFARQPLSLPEIIDGYRRFINQISAHHLVIVGIDELDKMHSDETAQRFLNEIKMLFGIEHCFYLVSVSESAMSSFERRGLPFRDAFDSAFDDILTVKYLALDDATRLLRRRVIGLPMPFLDLCYCISGGLARDLIRACRGLLEQSDRQGQGADLPGITTALIRDDVEAKRWAMAVIAKDIPLEPYATAFLEKLHGLAGDLARTPDPASLLNTLLASAAQLQVLTESNCESQGEVAKDAAAHLEQIGRLGLELASYLTYAATVLELFALAPSAEALKSAEETGLLDEVAQARQVFAINPGLSRSIIDQVRTRLGLATGSAAVRLPSRATV